MKIINQPLHKVILRDPRMIDQLIANSSSVTQEIMRDLHEYREMSSYLMIGVLFFATLSFMWSMYTQSDLSWANKDETTMDIESTLKNNRLFFGGQRLSRPKFSSYDEGQLLITPREAEETEATEF